MNQVRRKAGTAGFWMDWAAVIALVAAVAVFGLLQGGNFFSPANAVNILRSMSITTIFAIAATLTMAPDGFDMSACTWPPFPPSCLPACFYGLACLCG